MAQYSERISYEAYGNILKLNKQGNLIGTNVTIDSLTYYCSSTNNIKIVGFRTSDPPLDKINMTNYQANVNDGLIEIKA